MKKVSQILFLVLNGLLLTSAIPQYGSGDASSAGPAPAAGGAPPPPPPAPPAPAAAPASNPAAAPAAASAAQSAPAPAPGGGGELSVQCKATPDGSGKIKYDCSGVNKDAITLRTEHILWLESQQGTSQNLDIEIPNYNIDEFIKAAYKALGPQEGAKINILLKKPDVTYNAEKDEPPKADAAAPAVSVNYQPVEKISVHYPTQKQYSPSSGPAPPPPAAASASASSAPGASAPAPPAGAASAPAPPAGAASAPAQAAAPAAAPAAGGAYSRPQRESGFRYYFIRQ